MYFEIGVPVFVVSIAALTVRVWDEVTAGNASNPAKNRIVDVEDSFDDAILRIKRMGSISPDTARAMLASSGAAQQFGSWISWQDQPILEYTDEERRQTIEINRFIYIDFIDTSIVQESLVCSRGPSIYPKL